MQTQAERAGALARDAVQAARAALGDGDVAGALRWLDRARRYAPESPEVRLSLAAARFAEGAMEAAEALFLDLARRHDLREAWLGAAVAALRLGQPAAAAAALAPCLSRHRWDGERGVADAIVAAARLPGWCALGADGRVAVGPESAAAADLRIDDAAAGPRARRIVVERGGLSLLGSPIEAAMIERVEGMVQAQTHGLAGWAWHPGDAGRDPLLTLSDGVRTQHVLATDQTLPAPAPLTRPRGFAVAAAALAGFTGPIAVCGLDGTALAGSPVEVHALRAGAAALARRLAAAWPLDGAARQPGPLAASAGWPASLTGAAAAAPLQPDRAVAVIVPVYRGLAETLACLDALAGTLPPDGVLVVDDASPEPDLAAALDRLAAAGAIRLLRLAQNRGFPAAANAGLRAAAALPGGRDFVLLNNDTVPAPGWLDRLRAAVHGAPDIGTATPLSNDATIASYPDPAGAAPAAAGAALAALARDAARANPATVVDIPTAVGFCMYIRRECAAETGLFREDAFLQGYGEENDFCRRAAWLGWRHVAVPAAYVAHVGGRSFGPARAALLERNMAVLERLHPGYHAAIADWIAGDPLHPARRRLDALRWRRRAARRGAAVLLVTHESGGGVERCVRARAAALREAGLHPLLLRPVLDRSPQAAIAERRYRPGWCRIDDPAAPNLAFRLPDELPDLAALLRHAAVQRMEVHHLLGHHHAVLDLAAALRIPYEMRLHDYAWFCPRISLLGAGDRYCGEPEPAGCVACIDDLGSRLEEEIAIPELLRRSAADLLGAARVVAPSADAAQRLARHFPGVRAEIEPHEPDRYQDPPAFAAALPRTVCVVGAIGAEKGYEVLLACARDAERRGLPLRFVVVGHTIDDARLLRTGRVDVTGPYEPEEAVPLIRAQGAAAGFIPSIWPETWCLALGEVWRAGLAAVAFDIGAPAERIRATGRGWLLPLGLPPARVNDRLLALHAPPDQPLAHHGRVMQTV